jgi:hypothetical protein
MGCNQNPAGVVRRVRGCRRLATFRGDFAADLLQVQQREMHSSITDCTTGTTHFGRQKRRTTGSSKSAIMEGEE